MWKQLTKEEEAEFRQWARENFDVHKAYTESDMELINSMWHPMVQAECFKMLYEHVESVASKYVD